MGGRKAPAERYAAKRGFVLAAVWGITPFDSHYYDVRSEMPGRDAVVEGIRGVSCLWVFGGVTAVNLAAASAALSGAG